MKPLGDQVAVRQFAVAGLSLAVSDGGGSGRPVVFQHGLCGDTQQPSEVFPDSQDFRRVTLECRGHGASEAGDPTAFSIATFADDLSSLIQEQHLGPCVVGGISMGAAIALRIAVHRPELVSGLILARPAWTVDVAPPGLQPSALVGRLLARNSPEVARIAFERSGVAAELARRAPDNLASLRRLFDRKPLAITSALLLAITADGPRITWEDLERIDMPSLVIGHDRDVIHPLRYAAELACRIPTATLVRVTPKADDRVRHIAEMSAAIERFLSRRIG
jgi:pimeloyl-ACP methyl ester carboxylesterase